MRAVLRSTGDDIEREYGVGVSTLRKYTDILRKLGGIEKCKEWTEDRLRAALAVLDIKNQVQPPTSGKQKVLELPLPKR